MAALDLLVLRLAIFVDRLAQRRDMGAEFRSNIFKPGIDHRSDMLARYRMGDICLQPRELVEYFGERFGFAVERASIDMAFDLIIIAAHGISLLTSETLAADYDCVNPLWDAMEKQQRYKLDAHVRSNDEALADTVKDRARRSNRTITKEIERALRIAYKLGVGDDRPA